MELSAVIVFSLVLGCIMDGYAETMPTALSRRKGTCVDIETKMLDKFEELESSLKEELNSLRVNMQITKTELKAMNQRLRQVEQERDMCREGLGKVRDELNETRRGINVLEEQARSHTRMLRSELNGTIEDLSNTRQVMDGLTQDVKELTTCCVVRNETVPGTTTATPSAAAGRDLYRASRDGDLETVRRIVAAGRVDINYRGGGSRTPVMAAAREGHRDVLEFLVGEGADPSLVDVNGNNILHWACVGGHLEMVKLIVSLDMVDVNARNDYGWTAAGLARLKGHQQVVDLLVSRGAV